MRKLRKNGGFTLVECVVAMAVLAVMTLGLMMILSVTVKQRNLNTQKERNIDEQVEQVYVDDKDVKYTDVDDILISDELKITGVQKAYVEGADSNLQIGAVSIPLTGKASKGGATGNTSYKELEGDDPAEYKVYGALAVKNDTISIQYGASEDGNLATQGPFTDDSGEYYTVTWVIKFNSDPNRNPRASEYDYTSVRPELAVKIVLPPEVKVMSLEKKSNCVYAQELGNNTIRIQPEQMGNDDWNKTIVYAKLRIPASKYQDYYPSLENNYISKFYGDVPSPSSIPINTIPND